MSTWVNNVFGRMFKRTEDGAVRVTQGPNSGTLYTRTARFEVAADCAAYNATYSTFETNIETDLVKFDLSDLSTKSLQLRYHTGIGGTAGVGPIAPFIAVHISNSIITDAAAAAVLAQHFFNHSAAELTGGGTANMLTTDGIDTFLLSPTHPLEDVINSSAANYVYVVAIDDGAGDAPCALELRAYV